jgi:mitochondrial fission protein ELM1
VAISLPVTHPLSIWLICDGRMGHENQSLGLAEAIVRLVPGGIHRISIAGARGPFARIRAATAASPDLPPPDLILAAGHSTHPALWWLARKHRATSIVLMKPSLPVGCFDLCIAPAHDFPSGKMPPNLITTRGAINRVIPGSAERTGKLILIGGPSKTHGWDGAALLGMLKSCTDRGGWELTDSRRTPVGFLDQIRAEVPGLAVFPHGQTPPQWVPEKLGMAKEVWVTEDSISMIYEALTGGAKVGLLPVPRLHRDARVLRSVDALVADGYLTRFEDWENKHRLAKPPEVLREADRCAELVIGRLFDSPDAARV